MFKIIPAFHTIKKSQKLSGFVSLPKIAIKKLGLFLWGAGLILGVVLFAGLIPAFSQIAPSAVTVAKAAAPIQPVFRPLPQGPSSGSLWLSSSQPYTGFLTSPTAGDPLDIALAYLRQNRKNLGLTEADLAEIVVKDRYISPHNGVTHLYLRQRLKGIEVFNGDININITADGRVLNIGNHFVSDLQNSINSTTPTISAIEAVGRATQHLGLTLTAPLIVRRNISGPAQEVILSDGGISRDDIPVKLMYQPEAKRARLVWNMVINLRNSDNWWNLRVDAATGAVLSQNDWIVDDTWGPVQPDTSSPQEPTANFGPNTSPAEQLLTIPHLQPDGYRVYPMPLESPNHTSPAPPADGRTLITNPANATASPFGWHDTNGAAGAEFTTTQGNNVHAYTDVDDNDTPDAGSSPNGGAGLNFDFALNLSQAPNNYRPAAVTNLFYWNNIIHDVFYQYDFNEAAGNFQQNNYGRGGLGTDYVLAEAQDGADIGKRNNANFGTPNDGDKPQMQMFLWNSANPELDGDLDASIIVHEYGHGISNRLTGGPGNSSCLFNDEQMGEGWSDWLALALTAKAGDSGPVGRGIGTYALGEPTTGPGIRPFKYSTDMAVNPHTYDSIKGSFGPHDLGVVWAAMLWEMYWKLVERDGFNANFYGVSTSGGNNLAIQLVMDGMKLQPCSPGFVDGRNAILAADQTLTGGSNQCLIWEAFAKRGLGFSASQGSSDNREDGTEAFDLPPSCQFLQVAPSSINICQGQPATYTVTTGAGYSPPITLAVSGRPAGTTASFNPNPVNSTPGNSVLTIGNTGSAAGGVYTLTIQGTDATTSTNTTAKLTVVAGAPGTATLVAPANGANGQSLQPTFSWNAATTAASYRLEMAKNAGFASIVYSATVTGTSHTPSINLESNTTYYWRVIPNNGCGTGTASTIFSFTTATTFCNAPNIVIPDDDPSGITNTLTLTNATLLTDLDIYLDVSHTYIGDLSFVLTHLNTGTSVTLLNRPGHPNEDTFGCSGSDINTNLDDEATKAAESSCTSYSGLTTGPYRPNGLLSTFDNKNLNGVWQLTAIDSISLDEGKLSKWCLIPKTVTRIYLPIIRK